ncbi:hypothetical protein GW915_06485 [bacterium]|nr:hypothetical protein [bacterium]
MSDSSLERNVDKLVEDLLRALEISGGDAYSSRVELESLFEKVILLPSGQFVRIGFDLSMLIGVSGDWQMAYKLALKLEESNKSVNLELLKVWQLRCLVELERFSEALAIVRAQNWADRSQIHVNYLAGLAFRSLGMHQEAKTRFDAVNRKNPNYRDIALKLNQD